MEEKKKVTLDMENFRKKIQEAVLTITPKEAKQMLDELSEALTPYLIVAEHEELIKAELERRGYTGNMYKLADSDDPDEQQMFMDAFHAVVEALEKEKGNFTESKQIINVTTKRANSIEYPLDKINSNTWSKDQSFVTKVDTKKRNSKSKQDIGILYAVDFSQLEKSQNISISTNLTAYDKRVYIAVAALFNAGNEIMSTPMIYHAMGFTGDPGKSDKEQIYESIVKMRFTAIHIDTTKEANVYEYPKVEYNGALLPSDDERNALINGNLTERAIHFLREPPLITFAKERGQFTTFEIEVLQSPLSKTDINLKIEDYLLERIASAKHGWQPKILYKTIAEEAGVENMTIDNQRNLKKRLPSKVNKYLDYYVKCQFIKKYTTDKDGVTVFVPKRKE